MLKSDFFCKLANIEYNSSTTISSDPNSGHSGIFWDNLYHTQKLKGDWSPGKLIRGEYIDQTSHLRVSILLLYQTHVQITYANINKQS